MINCENNALQEQREPFGDLIPDEFGKAKPWRVDTWQMLEKK